MSETNCFYSDSCCKLPLELIATRCGAKDLICCTAEDGLCAFCKILPLLPIFLFCSGFFQVNFLLKESTKENIVACACFESQLQCHVILFHASAPLISQVIVRMMILSTSKKCQDQRFWFPKCAILITIRMHQKPTTHKRVQRVSKNRS